METSDDAEKINWVGSVADLSSSPVFTFHLQSLNFVILIMTPQLLIVLSDVRGRKETLSTIFSCCVLYPSFPLQGIVR